MSMLIPGKLKTEMSLRAIEDEFANGLAHLNAHGASGAILSVDGNIIIFARLRVKEEQTGAAVVSSVLITLNLNRRVIRRAGPVVNGDYRIEIAAFGGNLSPLGGGRGIAQPHAMGWRFAAMGRFPGLCGSSMGGEQ